MPIVPDKPPAPLLERSEWSKYREARQAAVEANPGLKTEFAEILKEMDAQQAKLDAAMIKADPNVALVVAKLKVLRQRNMVAKTSSSTLAPVKPAPSMPAVTMTQDDYQELRAARTAALQTDPDLAIHAKKLADKMRGFQDSLDAAMIKADPSVSLVIAKFEAGRSQPGTNVGSPGAK